MGNDVQTSSTGKKSPLGQCLIVGGGRRFERDGGTGTLDVRVLFLGEEGQVQPIFSAKLRAGSGGGLAMSFVVIVNRARDGGWEWVSGLGGWVDEKMVRWPRWQRRSRW